MFRVFFLMLISISFFSFHLSTPLENSFYPIADSTEFDFWVGTWKLEWDGGNGTNRIEKIMDGHVIQENFRQDSGRFAGYRGMSVTVFDKRSKTWKQTWVDNNGAYLDLTGGMEGERMILSRKGINPRTGEQVFQRMVWYNIRPDSLDWNWERSEDGKTWELLWHIHYTRN